MVRLLFDRRAKLVCAGLWGVGWLALAALLLLPLGGVPVPSGSDLIGHFLVFAAIAFVAVGFAREPAQLAWLTLLTIGLGADPRVRPELCSLPDVRDRGRSGQHFGWTDRLCRRSARPILRNPAGRTPVGLAPRHLDPRCSARRDARSFPELRGIKLPG